MQTVEVRNWGGIGKTSLSEQSTKKHDIKSGTQWTSAKTQHTFVQIWVANEEAGESAHKYEKSAHKWRRNQNLDFLRANSQMLWFWNAALLIWDFIEAHPISALTVTEEKTLTKLEIKSKTQFLCNIECTYKSNLPSRNISFYPQKSKKAQKDIDRVKYGKSFWAKSLPSDMK